MNVRLEPTLDLHAVADWLIVPMFADAIEPGELWLNQELKGQIARLRESGDWKADLHTQLALYPESCVAAKRILLAGLGTPSALTLDALLRLGTQLGKSIAQRAWPRIRCMLPSQWGQLTASQALFNLALGFIKGCHSPALKQKEVKRFAPNELLFYSFINDDQEPFRESLQRAHVVGQAVNLTRDLVNEPPSDLTPAQFAERCSTEANRHGFQCDILDQTRIASNKMNCLLSVAKGSAEPPRVVVLRYGHGSPCLGFVGKGVTFDSGGLSLKTNEQMIDMKCDMAGAATVLGAFTAIAQLQLPGSFLGVLALVENMPGPNALKLGDVLSARTGKTIEVLNTDAEGRLILADALDYAIEQKADRLIDLATLTGACMVALGTDVAGLFSNAPDWQLQVKACAEAVGEKVWPMPMFKEYGELLKSQVADIKNVGGKFAGAITAAKFLEHFVGETPWVHLDIAGPAFASEDSASRDTGGTGAYVATLVELARQWPDYRQSLKA